MVMLERLFFFLGDIHHTKLGGADSFSDQLSCKWTVFLLSLFAIISTARIYVSDPIGCFCPANFPPSQVDYTTKYCWATNTHYLPFDADSPKLDEPRQYISYYQWVPLFLAVQALLFYLPRAIWRTLSRKSGITLCNLTDAAIDCQRKAEQEGADKILSYLAAAYLVVKLLYVGNVVGQLFLLDLFLGTDFRLYGVGVVRRMLSGEDWTTSSKFPRVTMCDMMVRTVGENVHRHTVQCTLPLNLYNEMMFIFLWFWFVGVAVVTGCSLASWSVYVVSLPVRVRYVRSRLMMVVERFGGAGGRGGGGGRPRSGERLSAADGDVPTATDGGSGSSACDDADIARFVRKYLLCDGCVLLRLVAANSSDLVAAQLTGALFEHYGRGRSGGAGRARAEMDHSDPFRPPTPSAGGRGLDVPTVQIGLRRIPSKGDGLQN